MTASTINQYIIFSVDIFFGDSLEIENIFHPRLGLNMGPFRPEAINDMTTESNRALKYTLIKFRNNSTMNICISLTVNAALYINHHIIQRM